MSQVGDIIEVNFIQELDGVQMSNRMYWKIDDLGLDQSDADNLIKIMTLYHDSVDQLVSDAWKLVCGVFQNVTNPTVRATVFSTLVGGRLADSHPQFQVLRFLYSGRFAAGSAVERNAWNQSGVGEDLSTRGRLNDIGQATPFITFFRILAILPAGGWSIDPQVRFNTAIPPAPPVFAFIPTLQAQVNPKLFTLVRRKTKLCATS